MSFVDKMQTVCGPAWSTGGSTYSGTIDWDAMGGTGGYFTLNATTGANGYMLLTW
jgi:hypothetical protein